MKKWILNLGKIAGIKISIHWTFILLLFWLVMINWRAGHDTSQTLWSLALILCIFTFVVLHELGHALMAKRYGIKTQDITLLPIGGIARLEKMPEKPAQELAVAIAGPLVNVAIALLLLPLIQQQLSHHGLEMITPTVNSTNFLLNLFIVNLTLAIFNLLPAFPMDGGRVLRALLSFWMERVKATRLAAGLGQFMAIGFLVLGLLYNPFLVFIGLFIILGAQSELIFAETKSLLADYTVHDAMMKDVTLLHETDTLTEAVQRILDGQEQDFLVANDDQRITGTLNRNQVIKALSLHKNQAIIRDYMNKDVQPVKENTSLEEVFQTLQKKESAIVPVLVNHKLIGAINLENLMEFIMIKKAMTHHPAT